MRSRRGGHDQIALIVPIRDLDPGGNLLAAFGQLRLYPRGNLHGVAARLLIHLEEDGIAAVRGHAGPLRRGGMFDRRDILQAHHAGGRRTQHGLLDLFELLEARVGDDQIKFVVLFEPPDRDKHVRGRERLRHLIERHLEGLKLIGIDRDAVLLHPAA